MVVKEEEEGKEQRKDGVDYINLSLINIMNRLAEQMGNLNVNRTGTSENMNPGHGSQLTNTVTQARAAARAASLLARSGNSGVGKKLNFGYEMDRPGGRRRRRRRSSKRRKPRKSKKKRRRRRRKRTKKKRRRRRS